MFPLAGAGAACPSWEGVSTSGSRPRRWIADASASLLLGVNVVALLYLVGRWGALLAGRIEAPAGAFAALVIVGVLVSGFGQLPAALVAIAAGAVLGVLPGAALVFAAAFATSVTGFAASRALGPEFFERHVGRWDVVAAINRFLAERGLAGLWLLRAAPVFPFALAHLALAHTQVRAAAFAASSFAMLPWILFCCYCGSVMRAADSLASPSGAAGAWVFAVVIAAVALTRIAVRSACRALATHRPLEPAR